MGYKGPAATISDEKFTCIVLESATFVEVLRKLWYTTQSGGPYKTIKKRIKLLNIDTSHMTHQCSNSHGFKRLFTNDEIFCKNSRYQGKVRIRVLQDKLIPYKCAVCGNTGKWNNKQLTLTLDHINGDHSDNRLENLRFICPNCDSQQDTYAGKNINRYNKVINKYNNVINTKVVCPICGGFKNKGANMCDKCRREKVSKECKRPPKDELIQNILTFPMTKIGKKYGVSDNAVRKWLKYYELPTHRKDIMQFRKDFEEGKS